MIGVIRSATVVSGLLLGAALPLSAAYTFTPLDDPLASPLFGTNAYGIDGNTIVGQYIADTGGTSHGFIYNGSTFTTLDDPLAGTGAARGTTATGVFGNTVVGYYADSGFNVHGFIYDGKSYMTLDDPLADESGGGGTYVYGISGATILGSYSIGYRHYGFIYNSSTFTTLGYADLRGASGNKIVGGDFIYDGTTFTYLNDPFTPGDGQTAVNAISGNLVAGWYGYDVDTHGFIYDGTMFTTVDVPMSRSTEIFGISGNTVVGEYIDSIKHRRGFIATLPEPSSLGLTSLAAAALLCRRHDTKSLDRAH